MHVIPPIKEGFGSSTSSLCPPTVWYYIDLSQQNRSWTGSMMVVANQMIVNMLTSCKARPIIKSSWMAATQPIIESMVICIKSRPGETKLSNLFISSVKLATTARKNVVTYFFIKSEILSVFKGQFVFCHEKKGHKRRVLAAFHQYSHLKAKPSGPLSALAQLTLPQPLGGALLHLLLGWWFEAFVGFQRTFISFLSWNWHERMASIIPIFTS